MIAEVTFGSESLSLQKGQRIKEKPGPGPSTVQAWGVQAASAEVVPSSHHELVSMMTGINTSSSSVILNMHVLNYLG